MKRLLFIVALLPCICVAQSRRVPSLPSNNVPVDPTDAVTKQYVDDRTPPLATNGTNCPEGQFPRGVDEFGNAESCTAVDTSVDLTWPLISTTANPATVGQFRLAYSDVIAWRNALNNGNLTLSPDSDDNLVWSGNGFLSGGSGVAFWEGSVGSPSVASAGKGRISFSSTGNRPVWSYDGGAQVNILLEGDSIGSSATADAFTNNPADCSANQYAHTIAANGDLTCSQVAYSQVSGTPTPYYDIPLAYSGTPTGSEVIGGIIVTRTTNFAANFSGSAGYIGTNPTASFVISVKDNGSEIGTITISTGGVFTFATSGGTSKVVTAGHRLEFVAPTPADVTAAYILATLAGTN